jgi:thiamine-monophosphate kinase
MRLNPAGSRGRSRELGEFELIEKIVSRWKPPGDEVAVGPGDDASAFACPLSNLLILQTTDMLVEEVDFHKGWGTPWQLGWKALAVNLSDIAAMGGIPRHTHLSLAIPKTWTQDDILRLTDGFRELAEKYKISLLGGDLSTSPGPLVINVTVSGIIPRSLILRRAGAQPGELIWVSGTLGDAAGGLKLFQAEEKRLPKQLGRAFLMPAPQVKLGVLCANSEAIATLIDISDGLAGDLGHILKASKVGAVIEEKKLPVSKTLRQTAEKHGWNLLELVLYGGEDFQLLGCVEETLWEEFRKSVKLDLGLNVTVIGQIIGDRGLWLLRDDGRAKKIKTKGYEHVF